MTRRGARTKVSQGGWTLICAVVAAVGPGHAVADPVVADGLVALVGFHEGTGAASADLTGNGHDAELVAGATWCTGCAQVNGSDQRILIGSDPHIEVPSFTYDLWFEAGSTPGNGRLMGQAGEVGGRGADVLERSQHVAMRINNQGAVFDEPTIGSRSNDGPPDHWGTCEDEFHRNDGPEHLVITHDVSAQTVRIFIGLQGESLRLSFESTYHGTYEVDHDGIALLNLPDGDRFFTGKVYQFAYYDRVLTHQVDGNRFVTGGEVQTNHLAGPDAELPQGPGDDDTSGDDDTAGDDDSVADDDTGGDDDSGAGDDDATGPGGGGDPGGCDCGEQAHAARGVPRGSPALAFSVLVAGVGLVRRRGGRGG